MRQGDRYCAVVPWPAGGGSDSHGLHSARSSGVMRGSREARWLLMGAANQRGGEGDRDMRQLLGCLGLGFRLGLRRDII